LKGGIYLSKYDSLNNNAATRIIKEQSEMMKMLSNPAIEAIKRNQAMINSVSSTWAMSNSIMDSQFSLSTQNMLQSSIKQVLNPMPLKFNVSELCTSPLFELTLPTSPIAESVQEILNTTNRMLNIYKSNLVNSIQSPSLNFNKLLINTMKTSELSSQFQIPTIGISNHISVVFNSITSEFNKYNQTYIENIRNNLNLLKINTINFANKFEAVNSHDIEYDKEEIMYNFDNFVDYVANSGYLDEEDSYTLKIQINNLIASINDNKVLKCVISVILTIIINLASTALYNTFFDSKPVIEKPPININVEVNNCNCDTKSE
jgi:hypothetical protein